MSAYGQSGGFRSSGGRDSGPSYNHVLQEIRNAGMISTDTSVEVAPTPANEYLCVIKAEVIMPPLREGDPNRRYTSMGAAYPRKNAANVIHGVSNPAFYMHIAESRAKKRAWMDALGRNDGLEENIREEVFAERNSSISRATVVPALPVTWRMSDDAATRISTALALSFDEAKNMSREEAAAAVAKIKSMSQPRNTENDPF
ncbi:MAG: hypothetical protein EBR94_01290 [Bacteroidetes bacterium]|nr:hypothetical protein [Bacteroidota bacterium]